MMTKLYAKTVSGIEYNDNTSIISEDELLEYLICLPITEHKQSQEIVLFFRKFFTFFSIFFLFFFFFRVCLVFFFCAFSYVYVSYQASVIVVFKLDNDDRERERGEYKRKRQSIGKRESRSPSLIIIIAARLPVLRRQVYSILFFWQPICVSS